MSKEYITIDDFKKVDLRVGVVEEAERVPGSKKLIKLIVNLGNERRQVIAGLAPWYEPDYFKGKYVVIVANLKPKKLMGLESQGMILVAGCDVGEKPVPLTVPEPVKPGSRVC